MRTLASKFRDSRKLALAVLILLLAAGAAARFSNPNAFPRTRDEATYFFYAGILEQHGWLTNPRIVQKYNQTRNLWMTPAPTRIGYTALLAECIALSGLHDTRPGVWLSMLASTLTTVVVAVWVWNWLGPLAALATSLLLVVSPLELGMAQRIWQDSFFGFLAASLLALSWAIARRPTRWLCAGFLAAAFYAPLVKESSALLVGLCSLWTLAHLKRPQALPFAGAIAGALAASLLVLAGAAGGFSELLSAVHHMKEAAASNRYALGYQNGSWSEIATGMWLLSPGTLLLALGSAVVALRAKNSELRALSLYAAIWIALVSVTPNFHSLRYLSVANAALCVLAGAGAADAWKRLSAHGGAAGMRIALVVALAAVAFADFWNARKIFVWNRTDDLVTTYLSAHSIYRIGPPPDAARVPQ
ncbi:MAG: hypothetical protein JO317_03600 [Verrucomicrobiae bacterium]|nr:hypothetical protein [Verrucomicrobiae bacterium]